MMKASPIAVMDYNMPLRRLILRKPRFNLDIFFYHLTYQFKELSFIYGMNFHKINELIVKSNLPITYY